MRFMSSRLVAPPPVLGMTQESGLILRTSESQSRHSVEEPLLPPLPVVALRRVLRVRRAREIATGGGAEAGPAVLAVAHAGARPSG